MTRWIIAGVCALLAALSLVLAVGAHQANRTLFDTDLFVRTFAPLSDDQALHDHFVSKVRARLVSQVDLPELPFLDTAAIERRIVEEGTARVRLFVESDKFDDVWKRGIRSGHETFMSSVGDSDAQGTISFSLAPLEQWVNAANLVPEQFRDIVAKHLRAQGEIVLFRSRTLAAAQRNAKLLGLSSRVLPIAAAVLFLVGILVAPDRSGGVFISALMITLAAAAGLVGLMVGQQTVVGLTAVPDALARAAYLLATQEVIALLTWMTVGGALTALVFGWRWHARAAEGLL